MKAHRSLLLSAFLVVVVCTFWAPLSTAQQIFWKKDHIRDAGGTVIATAVPLPADQVAPTTPTNLSHSNLTQTSVMLSWNASMDSGSGLAGYKVYRGNLPIAAVTSTEFQDDSLKPGTNYVYTIVAMDKAGNHSLASGSDAFSSLPAWTKVGGDGVNTSWTGHGNVPTLTTMNGKVYAGLGYSTGDAEVWEYTPGGAWTQIGGDSVNSSWNSTYEEAVTLIALASKLYAGIGTSSGDAEVWEYNPATTTWTKIGGDGVNSSWGSGYEAAYAFATFNSKLYAGLSNSPSDGEVWQYDPGTTTWTQIGGDGVNASWGSGYDQVYTLIQLDSYLYAGLGNSTDEAEVWRYDPVAATWIQVGGDGMNSSWSGGYEVAEGFAVLAGKIYVGLGVGGGEAEVWAYTPGGSWAKIGGDGVAGSWSSSQERVMNLAATASKLYAALGQTADDAEVWEYDLASGQWTKIGGDSANGSWGSGYETAYGLTFLNGKLYVSLGDDTGDAEVWEYLQ